MSKVDSTTETDSQKSTIIAGSRTFGSGVDDTVVVDYVDDVVEESGFDVGEVVSGTARGADHAGELWAYTQAVPVEEFPAEWDNIDHPDAVVREGKHGKYDARAGHRRNTEMAEYADQLIALWDGKSSGTRDMIEKAKDILGEENVHVHIYK